MAYEMAAATVEYEIVPWLSDAKAELRVQLAAKTEAFTFDNQKPGDHGRLATYPTTLVIVYLLAFNKFVNATEDDPEAPAKAPSSAFSSIC